MTQEGRKTSTTASMRMKAEEELTLPPWEKFIKFGLFPFKLTIHIALLAIVTTLVLLVNIAFSGYSRAVWSSAVHILFPPDYTSFQVDTSTPYQYAIYTQNQTIRDVNYLIDQYFQLPDISVNNVVVYNNQTSSTGDENTSLSPPIITVDSVTHGTQKYTLYSPTDNDGFPLSYNNLSPSTSMKDFFYTLKSMRIDVELKSYGITDTSHKHSENICFHWKWTFYYNAKHLAQISVNTKASILAHCDGYTLPSSSSIYGLSVALLLLAIWYQILLFKAVWRQMIILNLLRSSHWEAFLLQNSSTGIRNPSVSKRRNSNRKSSSSYRAKQFEINDPHRIEEESEEDKDTTSEIHSKENNRGDLYREALELSQPSRTDEKENEEDLSPLPTLHPIDEADYLLGAIQTAPMAPHFSTSSHHRKQSSSSSFRSTTSTSIHSITSRQAITFATIEEDFHLLQEALQSLTWKDKFLIVNLWFVISTIGNVFALLFAGRMVMNHTDIMAERYLKVGLGLSCLAYWFSLVQYLEFFPRYYIMISMLKITVPRVSQFLLGVLPLFFGYALLGMICFGDISSKFGDIIETLRTLFSVVNGDIIYDTFYDIDEAGLGGQLYIYIYMLLFTYVVLMTIIAIVEEAFFEAQDNKSITNSTTNLKRKNDSADDDENGDENGADKAKSDRSTFSSQLIVDHQNLGGKGDQNSGPNSTNNSYNTNNSMMGKRDLPEHVRFLLKNVDKLPSSSSSMSFMSASNVPNGNNNGSISSRKVNGSSTMNSNITSEQN